MSWIAIDLMIEAATLEAVQAHREYTVVFFGADDMAYLPHCGWVHF